jgi:glycosyltransferase involved in cell wall biosynthesis
MKVAILGTRGIPANYGGFETFAEELSVRLAERGHAVTVYGRRNNIRYKGRFYRGVRLIVLPTVGTKHLDTLAHTAISVVDAAFRRFDCVLVCNAANAILAAVPRLAGTPVALNVDGIERKRKKWGWMARTFYLISERLATFIPDVIVTDAAVIQAYYMERYRAQSTMIAYGADCTRATTTEVQDRLGLSPRGYALYVSRLEPENNARMAVDAYRLVQAEMPLVIVGDAPHAGPYIAALKAAADPRVRFTGGIYGQGYRELQSHAFIYIHATEVGGTHPALIEGMAVGNCVMVFDTPENREAAGDAALYFDSAETLAAQIQRTLGDPGLVERMRAAAQERARRLYSWDTIADRYERLFFEMSGQ